MIKPQLQGANLLTNSRMACYKTCPRKHFFQYELGIRKSREGMPLRFGGNTHWALDLLAQGRPVAKVCATIRAKYAEGPPWSANDEQLFDWYTEGEKVARIVEGYAWRWKGAPATIVASEQGFMLPLRNPRTGAASSVFKVAGVLDRLIDFAAQLLVQETKTTGTSIQSHDYWLRTRLDQQVTLYYWAARETNYDVDGIEWDAIHRPGINPRKRSGETISAFGERLAEDIRARPDFYFQRRPVPRIAADIDDFLAELWQVQKSIRLSQRMGYWYRNTAACLVPFRCEYLDICHGAGDFSDGIPEGFWQVINIHPELELPK